MADFCKQCSLDIFQEDFKELAGITTEADVAADRYAVVICEGCGPTQVRPDGSCIGGCMKREHTFVPHSHQGEPPAAVLTIEPEVLTRENSSSLIRAHLQEFRRSYPMTEILRRCGYLVPDVILEREGRKF